MTGSTSVLYAGRSLVREQGRALGFTGQATICRDQRGVVAEREREVGGVVGADSARHGERVSLRRERAGRVDLESKVEHVVDALRCLDFGQLVGVHVSGQRIRHLVEDEIRCDCPDFATRDGVEPRRRGAVSGHDCPHEHARVKDGCSVNRVPRG